MWSGGRSLRSVAVAAGVLSSLGTAAGQTPLCNGQHPGNPELISGAASCFYNEVNGGQTLIQLNANSIIRWDRLALEDPASTLLFEWLGAPTANAAVLNRVEQGGRQEGHLNGTVAFPAGHVILTHPNTGLNIGGTVQGRAVTIATHRLDEPDEFQLLDGQMATFTGSTKPLKILGGRVIADGNDVVLAGQSVAILPGAPGQGDAEVLARAPAGSVRVFGGENFQLLPENVPAGSPRIQSLPGGANGNVLNARSIRAQRGVEIVAEADIRNDGLLQADGVGGIVMMRVDAGGTIVNESNGIISADVIVPFPAPGPGKMIEPDRGDSASPLSMGLSRIPVVSRPGEGASSKRVTLRESAPVTGSASAQRQRVNRPRTDRPSRDTAVASTGAARSGHLARGRSFFGVRGGKKAEKK